MDINKDVRVKLDLDLIDASLVVEAINAQLEHLLENPPAENIIKYTCLAMIVKEMVDQVIPIEDQWKLLQEYKKDQIILQALKKEKGE